MQAKSSSLRIALVVLIASLVLSACSGSGNEGSTWFNLPSLPIQVQENGTGTVFGFNVGFLLQPALIQQLQAANVQELEVRIGYNGIHIYSNGDDLPYITWNGESVNTLQDVLQELPNIPNRSLIANALPWLRRVGTGVVLDMPLASGTSALNVPSWQGETTVSPESPDEANVIGPFVISSLAFDENGAASIDGIPLSELEQLLGMSIPLQLDPSTLNILSSLNAETLTISTHPNGIELSLNDRPLPGIAYDQERLQNALSLAQPFLPDPELATTLADQLPKIIGADVTVAVSFTGEPVGPSQFATIPVEIAEDGTAQVFGIPVSSTPVVQPDMLQKLQAVNLQRLDVQFGEDRLILATNGQALPTIVWTDDSLANLSKAVGGLLGTSPDLFARLLSLLRTSGLGATVSLPPAAGAEVVEIPAEISTDMQPPDLGDFAPPVLQVGLVYDQSNLQAIDGISADTLDEMGIQLPLDLPPNIASLLYDSLNANEVKAATGPGQLEILVDDNTLLMLIYDAPALQRALDLATPFLPGNVSTFLADPNVSSLLKQEILPLVPGADVNLTAALQ